MIFVSQFLALEKPAFGAIFPSSGGTTVPLFATAPTTTTGAAGGNSFGAQPTLSTQLAPPLFGSSGMTGSGGSGGLFSNNTGKCALNNKSYNGRGGIGSLFGKKTEEAKEPGSKPA